MHDTPSKAYLIENKGPLVMVVFRLARPRDLAIEILKDDKNWTAEKIDIAMNRRVERTYNLKPKYPCTLVILRLGLIATVKFIFIKISMDDERLSKILSDS
jgi:murein L,D-transpeptidase YcbB/YkuD